MANLRFDEHSFLDEIKTEGDARSCYDYLTHNMQEFKQELQKSGLSYDEMKDRIRQVWLNLLKSSKRVGFTNPHLKELEDLYSNSK